MPQQRKFEHYVADFETVVYKGQERTDVWLGGFMPVGDTEESIRMYSKIEDFIDGIMSQNKNMIVWFHNLSFDGSFILDYFLHSKKYKQALVTEGRGDNKKIRFKKNKYLHHNEYTYLISKMGVWYELTVSHRHHLIKFIDSYKLLPFRLSDIGDAFETQHRKLSMEYKGYRYPGWNASQDEKRYFMNDLLVASEALAIMFADGHTSPTIGSCAMVEYKNLIGEMFERMFPNVFKNKCLLEIDGVDTEGEFVHRAYRGAWCYVKKNKKGRVIKNGRTFDVNSLYPYVMHSMSGNRYAMGAGTFWVGELPELGDDIYYYYCFDCAFDLKRGMLPFVQVKGDFRYKPREHLESSAIESAGIKSHYANGKLNMVRLYMSKTHYELFLEHYDIIALTPVGGVYYNTEIGLFDKYIDKWMGVKMASTGASRTEAKLFLNNLYGKFATYIDSSFKVARLDGDIVRMETVEEYEKKPGYIPIGAAITSNALAYTVRSAQKNINNFCYADTDSIHLINDGKDVCGIKVDSKALGAWKEESIWSEAIFGRAKTYVEITNDWQVIIQSWDGKNCDESGIIIRCAGMRPKVKAQIILGMAISHGLQLDYNLLFKTLEFDAQQIAFVNRGFDITYFRRGLEMTGNLKSRRIPGGIVLEDAPFKWR